MSNSDDHQVPYTQRVKDLLRGAAAARTFFSSTNKSEVWRQYAETAGADEVGKYGERFFTNPVSPSRTLSITALRALIIQVMTESYMSEDWLEDLLSDLRIEEPDKFRREVLTGVEVAKERVRRVMHACVSV